jgi:CDP-diacylglycerol---glycerol-3-phosphate 3-phosphatidyltransferase
MRQVLPNLLTLLRIASVPVLAVLLAADGGMNARYRDLAAVIFVLASFTDFVDGALARRWNVVTRFGRILDPIADKALVAVALIGLALLDELAWWIVVVILGRELLVTYLRARTPIPVRGLGKAKTLAQIVAITMYLAVVPGVVWWQAVSQIAMGVAVILTVGTGVLYVRQAVRT